MSDCSMANVCPGRAYIRSRLKVEKQRAASCRAARACAVLCTLPIACKAASLKLCTPTDKRVTPAWANAAKRSRSKVPGLASSVISHAGSRGKRARSAEMSSAIASGLNRLGVPPPKNTL